MWVIYHMNMDREELSNAIYEAWESNEEWDLWHPYVHEGAVAILDYETPVEAVSALKTAGFVVEKCIS